MEPKISIILLNWNNCEYTLDCLASLEKLRYTNYEIIIVDNGSTDNSVERIRKRYPNIILLQNKNNLGFAEGNNVGIRFVLKKGTDYVFLLNNDTVVDADILNELVNTAEGDPEIGIVGPKIYYYSEKNRIWFAGGKIDLSRVTWIDYHIGLNQIDEGQFDEAKEVDFITGCALLAKASMLHEIGLLNHDFFIYYEDTDLCIRAKKKGYKCFYAPRAIVWHKISSTMSEGSPSYIYYTHRNRIRFYLTNFSKIYTIYFIILVFFIRTPAIVFTFLLKHRFDLIKSYLKALKDNIFW